ncbi:acetyl-CoA carboxylase biotin carboxylase subunit family protein [Mesorhizobium australicum]|uniref:ATP-grasp domain-containing protein n=1 Tax=Mesorhizobium australicum TaxID=536018 RepID=UPI003336AC1E
MSIRAFVMVEGASNTLLYVEAAQRLGLRPIILSADPARFDYLAQGSFDITRVDTDNLDALICECSRLLLTYDIAGIAGAEEQFYATVGKLCQHFDMPGPNPTSVERCCDKFTQRQLLAEEGIPIPAYRLAASARDIESAAAEIGLPVVLKPAVGIGSVGVRLCRNVDEIAEHTTDLLGGKHTWRSSPKILVEEFAQGPHYSAEMMGNEVIGIGAADFGPPPHFVSREYTYPAPLTNDEHRWVADVSLSCLRALSLGWGPSNIDLRWTKRGPVVIEVNPRLAGTPTPRLVELAYGVDLVTEHTKLAIGEEWKLRRGHSQFAAARILLANRDGSLDWIGGENRAAAVPGVAEVKLYVKPKTAIVRNGDCGDRIGHVIVTSTTLDGTKPILQRAVDLLELSITPFPTIGSYLPPQAGGRT